MATKKSLIEAATQILSEAAIDTLQQDALTNQEPMHHSNSVGDPNAAVVDLGGASSVDPSGGPVGVKAAAARPQAHAPKGPVVAAEPIHKGPEGGAKGTAEGGEPEVKPTMATPSGTAPTAPGTEEAHACTEDVQPTAEEIEAARKARLESIRETMKTFSVDEDVNAMFAGVDLSEDFRKNAKTIFEAAVIARAVAVVEQLEKEILQASEQAVEEIREELETNVDSYLDHMVEQWMQKNAVAIESGLKTEITEEFIEDLRNLFLEHNINIPEEKVDVVESLTKKVEELQGQINEVLNTNVELNKQINESNKTKLIGKVCEGLTATQTERFRTLAEGVEFTTEGEYTEKLNVLKTQYFSPVNNKVAATNPVVIAETADPSPVMEEEIVDPVMRHYSAAIRRTFSLK